MTMLTSQGIVALGQTEMQEMGKLLAQENPQE